MLSTEAKLTDLVSRMKEYAAENLESIILYGSAARGDHKEGHSDLNVLCVLRSVAARELTRVTPVVHWWCKDQNEPAPALFHRRRVAPLRRCFFHRTARYAATAAAFSLAPMSSTAFQCP